MSEIDRARAQTLLAAEGLEGLVLFRPEAFRYATGLNAGVATMWGRAGSAIALVPADAGAPLAAVMSDHAAASARPIDIRTHRIWIDGVTVSDATTIAEVDAAYRNSGNVGPRPETFDQMACFGLLRDLLAERGLTKATLGVDCDFMPAADFALLQRAIPDVTWRDGSQVLRRLRLIKNDREIERLRRAAHCAEAGLESLMRAARPGCRSRICLPPGYRAPGLRQARAALGCRGPGITSPSALTFRMPPRSLALAISSRRM